MTRTIGSDGARTFELIRRAGLRLIHEHGYEGMSLRQLAREVGLQPASLYNHIHTKQDLLVDLIQQHMQDLFDARDRALTGIADPLERLRAFIRFHLHHHMVRKAEVFVVNFELRSLVPKNYSKIIALREAYERSLGEILQAGIDKGQIQVPDVRIATMMLLATITGVCTWYQPRGRLSEEEVIEIHTKLILEGFLSAP